MKDRITPLNITKLNPGEVFVFGSNTIGRHGKGAAKTALKFGAKPGIGEGLCGNTYGIPTKDHRLQTLSLQHINVHIGNFIKFAIQYPEKTFLVTEIGCGLAGYKPKDIAPLFYIAQFVDNIHLPEKFWHKLELK